MEQRVAECGLRSRGQCRAHLPRLPSAASPGILAYTSEDVDILDRRARLRSDPRGTMSRIHNLRLRQRLLRLELRDAKRRLMVPDSRWTYDRQYSSLLSLVREQFSRYSFSFNDTLCTFHDCSSRGGEYGLARSVVPRSARGRDVHPAEARARVQESRPVDHLLRLLPAAIVFETGGNIHGDPDHLT